MAAANGLISPSNLRNGDLDDLVNDFEFLLREGSHQRRSGSRSSSSFFADANAVDMNRYSSGSTVSDEDTTSNPAFLPYHYTNPRFSPPAVSMEDWKSAYGKINESGDQVFGCGINDGNNCSLFTLKSNFQSSSDPFIGFKRNSIGLKNRSFADVLQANLPQSHFQSSSTATNRSKSEASSTELKSFTASGLPIMGQNAYNHAVDDRDFCKYSSVQRSPSSMNSYIYGGERVSRNQPYFEKKAYFNGGRYCNFTSSPRVKYPVSSLRQGSAGSSMGEFNSFRKSSNLEISDIVGHAIEFSVDQYGSRFLQQKLETASCEDKNLIFPEILSHALALMADVFGNYVIQKFLEHGNDAQRRQLASRLCGHVLSLSLQVYGCRVIQKALEVIDVDQRVELVSELDGAIMICVCDQNGNHVIQKCIECIPQERIRFIVDALRGHILNLSLHPYGCRVIQRVLESCTDASTQRFMMDEILNSLSSLAQDQYGNYVVQHILHHGSKKQRSAILCHLAGKIGALSQQKFSSNVVEKCLTFCTPEEHGLMVNEMLESVDGNEPPLLEMMKDQFGNYVVQKALETCDDKSREMILSRVKAHVGFLKKSTYAKHVSARVDKVIAAGERRMRMSSY